MFSPKGKPVFLIFLFTILSFVTNFQDGYSNSYVNTAYDGFQDYFNQSYLKRGSAHTLSKWAWTWIWSVFLNIWSVGMMLGIFATPYLSDHYGRKIALIVSAIVSICGTALAVLGIILEIPELVLVARTIASASTGISWTTLYIFIQEVSPTPLRGTCSFMVENTYMFTNVLGFAFGWDLVLGKHVGILTAVGLIPGLFALLLIFPLKETPKFMLIHKNNQKAAIDSIIYYQGSNINIEETLKIIQKEAEDERLKIPLKQAIWNTLLVPHLRTALIIGIMVFNLVNPVWAILYMSSILLEAYFSDEISEYVSFGYILSQFFAGLGGALIVDRFGRRPLLLISAIVNTLTIVAYILFDRMAFYFGGWYKYGCIGSLLAYGITYGIALGPICSFITTEVSPQKYRSLIQSIALFVNTVISLVITFLALPAYNWFDIWSFIPLFILPSTISIVYIAYVMPETNGKEIYQIIRQLKRSNQK